MSKYPDIPVSHYRSVDKFTQTLKFQVLVCGDITHNANKFYSLELQTDGDGYQLFSHYGRIGQTGAFGRRIMPSLAIAEKEFDKTIKSKRKKGYRDIELASPNIGSSNIRQQVQNASTPKIALDKFKPSISSLISFFAEENIHDILGKTALTLTGRGLQTPLGPVSHTQIAKARAVLKELSVNPSTDLMNQYFSMIPREMKAVTALTDNDFARESELLDQIESAVSCEAAEIPFDLDECDPKDVRSWFEKSRASNHQNLLDWKVLRTFDIIRKVDNFVEENIVKVWHGSRTCNVLSILVNGLVIPLRPSTGRMFGPAVYGAINSTKALNYSTGFWGNGPRTRYNNLAYLFVAEFAMGGNIYYPSSSFSNSVTRPYTSAWAQKDRARLYNDELMVYDTNRCRLLKLVELKKGI